MLYRCSYTSPLGDIILVGTTDYLTHLNFFGQKHFLYGLNIVPTECEDLKFFRYVKAWLNIYFSGIKPNFDIPIKPFGTDFQKSIWNVLSEINYGECVSYSDIAEKADFDSCYCRAVATAVSKNPILIIIPCHRVISSNGSLSGYVAGVEKKKKLLDLELSYPLSKPIIAF